MPYRPLSLNPVNISNLTVSAIITDIYSVDVSDIEDAIISDVASFLFSLV